MSACADYLLTTARYNDPEKGPQCLLCFLPTNTKGVQIQNNWDTMSIRSSCSNDVVWDNVFISKEAAVPRPVQTWDALSNITSSWWVASGPACYIGLAQAAHAFADPVALGAGVGVGISSSVIPYVFDQLAMARIARATYALFVALLPATALVIGVIVLGQLPTALELAGVALVMVGVALHRPAVEL